MAINAEVQKSGSENALSVIRKFSRRVQGTGLVKTVRGQRYYEREKSKTVSKKRALKLLKRRETFQQMVKEGKVAERETRGRGSDKHMSSAQTTTSQTENRERTSGSGLGENTPIAR